MMVILDLDYQFDIVIHYVLPILLDMFGLSVKVLEMCSWIVIGR